MLVEQGFNDCQVTIQGDNTGVTGTFNKVRSHSMPCNDSIWHIASYIIPNNITIHPVYVPSTLNWADWVSHGILGSPSLHETRPLDSHQSLFIIYKMSRSLKETSTWAHISPSSGGPVSFVSPPLPQPEVSQRQPRLPSKFHDCIVPNSFCPSVVAVDCFMQWLTPYGIAKLCNDVCSFPIHSIVCCRLLISKCVLPPTLSSYSAGLICFTKFCNDYNIPEEQRMLASEILLSMFITIRGSGLVGNSVMKTWLEGLC